MPKHQGTAHTPDAPHSSAPPPTATNTVVNRSIWNSRNAKVGTIPPTAPHHPNSPALEHGAPSESKSSTATTTDARYNTQASASATPTPLITSSRCRRHRNWPSTRQTAELLAGRAMSTVAVPTPPATADEPPASAHPNHIQDSFDDPVPPPPDRGQRKPNRYGRKGSVRVWDYSTARRVPAPLREFELVRSRRASWSLRTIPCGWCGIRVRESESGRERRWCSDACRMKSYRAHRRGERRVSRLQDR